MKPLHNTLILQEFQEPTPLGTRLFFKVGWSGLHLLTNMTLYQAYMVSVEICIHILKN